MPGMNGAELGYKIREDFKNYDILIVYISSHRQYDRELFKNNPFNFLEKPVSKKELEKTLKRAVEIINDDSKTIFIDSFNGVYRVSIRDILYLKYENRIVEFVMAEKSIKTSGQLVDFEIQLKKHNFIRVNKDTLVSISLIKKVTKTDIIMVNLDAIQISRNYKQDLKRELGKRGIM